MINHIRTLLLNRPSAGLPEFGSVEEFTPPDYHPVSDTPDVLALRHALFGIRPDVVFLNYRAHMLMRMLHASMWSDYITHADSRITYDITAKHFRSLPLLKIAPSAALPVSVVGQHWADERIGICSKTWHVRVTGSTKLQVSTINTGSVIEIPREDVITLPTSSLSLAMPSTATTGFFVSITAVAKPVKTLADVLNAVDSGIAQQAAATIFNRVDSAELLQLYDRWVNEPVMLSRYAALLFGLAKYTELAQT